MNEAATVVDLRDRYDVFMIDQFGTIHDGVTPYPGALRALRALRATGAKVVLLSNSGKRAAHNAIRLTALGIPPDAYDLFVTSGEVFHNLVSTHAIPAIRHARRAFVVGRGQDDTLLDGLDLVAVQDEPDVVLIAGSEGDRRSLDSYREALGGFARAGVPALCLNPDRTMLTPSGPAFGAGRIAEAYGDMGGDVTWIGKPHPAIYERAFGALGALGAGRERSVGVGDSVEHDIAGARAAGIDGWLVRTGILDHADDAAVAAECARVGVQPDGVLRAFG